MRIEEEFKMGIHIDEKENYKKRIEKMKQETERRNKEIQKEKKKKNGN